MSESFANVSFDKINPTSNVQWYHIGNVMYFACRNEGGTWVMYVSYMVAHWRGIVIFYLEMSILLMFVNDIFATHGFCKEVLHTSTFSFAFMILYVSVFSLSKRRQGCAPCWFYSVFLATANCLWVFWNEPITCETFQIFFSSQSFTVCNTHTYYKKLNSLKIR